ncbi:MAG: DUF3592 domain-containing protein [Chloroflexota bacterium]
MPANDSNFTLVLLAIPPLFILAFLASAFYNEWLATQLSQSGVITEAQIVDLGCDSWRGTRHCYVVYEFTNSAQVTEGRQTISETHFSRLQKGDQVVASYFPQRPTVSRLVGTDLDPAARNAALRRALAIFVMWIVIIVLAVVIH